MTTHTRKRCPGSNQLPAKHTPWLMTCSVCPRAWIEGHHLAGRDAPIHYVAVVPFATDFLPGQAFWIQGTPISWRNGEAGEVLASYTGAGFPEYLVRIGGTEVYLHEKFLSATPPAAPTERYADQRAHDTFWQTAQERNAPARGCAQPVKAGLSFASSWSDIATGFCPNAALPNDDYCADHAQPQETHTVTEPVNTEALHQYSDDSEIVAMVREYLPYVDAQGIIRTPGKFESEPIHTVYFYGWLLNGDGDTEYVPCEHAESDEDCDCELDEAYTTFHVGAGDEEAFPVTLADMAGRDLRIRTDDQGFVTSWIVEAN